MSNSGTGHTIQGNGILRNIYDDDIAGDECGKALGGAVLAKDRPLRLQFLHCGGGIAGPSISRKVICTRTPFHRGARILCLNDDLTDPVNIHGATSQTASPPARPKSQRMGHAVATRSSTIARAPQVHHGAFSANAGAAHIASEHQ